MFTGGGRIPKPAVSLKRTLIPLRRTVGLRPVYRAGRVAGFVAQRDDWPVYDSAGRPIGNGQTFLHAWALALRESGR